MMKRIFKQKRYRATRHWTPIWVGGRGIKQRSWAAQQSLLRIKLMTRQLLGLMNTEGSTIEDLASFGFDNGVEVSIDLVPCD